MKWNYGYYAFADESPTVTIVINGKQREMKFVNNSGDFAIRVFTYNKIKLAQILAHNPNTGHFEWLDCNYMYDTFNKYCE